MVRRLQAFTLLELLIVIGLIGILVAVSVTSYGTIQKKSRDSRRMSDMKAVQNAFEQYYADENGTYPTSESDITSTSSYLPSGMPKDPKYDPNDYPVTYDPVSGANYCACALLEVTMGNDDAPDCLFTIADSKVYYCVKNLQ